MFNLFKKNPKVTGEEIIVVTGATGFGGSRLREETMWKYSCSITAWKRPGQPIVVEESKLFIEGQQEEIRKVINGVARDRIYRVSAIHENGKFTLVKVLGKSSDVEMEEFLAKQLMPTYYTDEEIGEFLLDRTVNWYEKEIDWLNTKIRITFDRDSEEKMKHSCATLRTILENMEKWDNETRICASNDLLELKNDVWLGEDEEIFTPKDFQSRLTLTSIGIANDEEIDFWFDDGNIFWGHSICVNAHIEKGCVSASMHG